ncbi:MAG TPA: copper chaperone PCu(A)C [Paracoccus sp. (in: a-proteobacteria)]|uniref:copper chaperone PCu(A)C n=1 Tax=uncultured Paracoccus sp. TaxID=189685 RepID=UPI002636195E|nr:copper chaperone PCu(A)C [uncultured Paracoccus sp.]HMQ39831.1 copper chaperone PCu(A)C [Paracoccus sp. (in: a-proteobacteria)]
MKHVILAAVAALSLPAAALAQDVSIKISDEFARSSNPKSGAAFMTIQNDGQQECTLIAASSPAAPKVELHTTRENADGMMEMLPIEGGITIAAGGSHALARGGDHIMLMNIPTPLQQGDEVPMALDFGECGVVELVVPLDNERTGTVAGEMKMDHGAMDHSAH